MRHANRKTVLVLFGTRPEAIKMGPVVEALRRHPRQIRLRIAVTGQHREMLDQVLRTFRIRPHLDLRLMRRKQTLTELTSRALRGVDEMLRRERPGLVLVQGDTTTAMAGALAAYYARIPVGHVEAGLRTYDIHHPYPEEVNRRIISAMARLHFAPTRMSVRHLLKEGVPAAWITLTGNTVIDALHTATRVARNRRFTELAQVDGWKGKIILVTAHRRENWGKPFAAICDALRQLAARYPAILFVYPVHPNPVVSEDAHRRLGGVPNIRLLAPLSYLPLVSLLARSFLVLTDSGGIQEEAPGLSKPVLILREKTERPEAVQAGVAKLVGTDTQKIVRETVRLIEDKAAYRRMAQGANPYGDGKAAGRIVQAIIKFFCD